jgi:hypothetical protein
MKILMVMTVSYQGNPSKEVDEIIKKKMGEMGFTFYAGGYNFMVSKRDLSFEREIDHEHIDNI